LRKLAILLAALGFSGLGSPWIAGLEYLYYGFDGSTNTSGITTSLGSACPTIPATVGAPCTNYSVGSFNVQTVRLRLSQKLN